MVLLAVLATLAACGLAFAVYVRMFRRASSTEVGCHWPETEGGAVRAAERRTQNEYASRALAALAAAQAAAPTPQVPPPSPPPATERPPDDYVPLSKEGIVARQKADAQTLDNQLEGEEVDGPWATRIERETTEAMLRLSGKFHLEGITCRETLCRATVTHLDPRVREENANQLMNLPVVTAQAFAFALPNDERTTVLYFSRKGTTLSPLQPSMDITIPGHLFDTMGPE